MPTNGAVQVTIVEPSCLQVEGGSLPVASPLLLVTMTAFISALVVCFGFAGGIAILAGREPLSPAQVPSPAATRTTAARSASQRGRRYQCGPCGRPGGG